MAYPLRFCFCKGWAPPLLFMPKKLKRIVGRGDLHFVNFYCYQRRALLGTVKARNLAAQILDEVRKRYKFKLIGYVIMPEHVHLLIGESADAPPAKVIQVFKQRLSRRMRGRKPAMDAQKKLPFCQEDLELRRFWQRRYYDFNLHTAWKLREKLDYMHANPVRAKLVRHPRDWPWSSWSYYATGEGLLRMDVV